jgi:hypothetical protein
MKKKVESKCDQFQIEMQHLEEVWWPLFVRFTFNKLLHIIGIPMWGVGCIPCNAFSWIEKDGDIDETIQMSKVDYTKLFKLAWDAHN